MLAPHRPPVALILFAIGISGAQVLAHRSASIHAAPRSTAIRVDLSAPREHIPGGILTAVLPLVVLLGLGLWVIPHLDELPTRLPVQWSLGGANRWLVTSARTIIVLLLQHALICLVLIASALGVLHWSRRIAASGPSAISERQFRRRAVLLILIGGLGEFKSLTYEGTDSDGSDVYLAAFERGQLQWHVGPLVDGKVTYRRVRPVT